MRNHHFWPDWQGGVPRISAQNQVNGPIVAASGTDWRMNEAATHERPWRRRGRMLAALGGAHVLVG